MENIGVFDNTNYNYILKFLRDIYEINIIDDFKIYNAFSIKNIMNEYNVLLILSNVNRDNREKLKHVMKRSKVIILNGDDKAIYKLLDELKLSNIRIISFGFGSKSTITVSSIDELENRVMCALQRSINNISNKKINPKEFNVSKGNSVFSNVKFLGIVALMIYLGYLK